MGTLVYILIAAALFIAAVVIIVIIARKRRSHVCSGKMCGNVCYDDNIYYCGYITENGDFQTDIPAGKSPVIVKKDSLCGKKICIEENCVGGKCCSIDNICGEKCCSDLEVCSMSEDGKYHCRCGETECSDTQTCIPQEGGENKCSPCEWTISRWDSCFSDDDSKPTTCSIDGKKLKQNSTAISLGGSCSKEDCVKLVSQDKGGELINFIDNVVCYWTRDCALPKCKDI